MYTSLKALLSSDIVVEYLSTEKYIATHIQWLFHRSDLGTFLKIMFCQVWERSVNVFNGYLAQTLTRNTEHYEFPHLFGGRLQRFCVFY